MYISQKYWLFTLKHPEKLQWLVKLLLFKCDNEPVLKMLVAELFLVFAVDK